jgi:hypothetical protein
MHTRDTWQGETFSREEIVEMLDSAGLSLAAVEDPGTQYFVVTARKGPAPDRRTYYLPGEPEDGGWRPVAPHSTIRLFSPGGEGVRLYVGLYFWPEDQHAKEGHSVTIKVDATPLDARIAHGPGDHSLEWMLPLHASGSLEVTLDITPPCARPHWPALRIVGVAPAPKLRRGRLAPPTDASVSQQ